MAIKDTCLAPRASKKKKGTLRRPKFVGDFIPWVPPISHRSPDKEEKKEKEDDMSGLIHNFDARNRKRDVILEQVANVVPNVAGGSGQLFPDGGSEVQTIVISGSPEMGLNDQPALRNVTLAESKEASPVPAAIQVVYPPEQAISQSNRAKYTRTGRRKPLLPNRMLVNSYLSPRGPSPPMGEVTVLGPEGAQEIVDQWRPFNLG